MDQQVKTTEPVTKAQLEQRLDVLCRDLEQLFAQLDKSESKSPSALLPITGQTARLVALTLAERAHNLLRFALTDKKSMSHQRIGIQTEAIEAAVLDVNNRLVDTAESLLKQANEKLSEADVPKQ